MTDTPLKPCPFCANSDILPVGLFAVCNECRATIRIDAWNTRHTPEITDEDVERAYAAFYNEGNGFYPAIRAALTAFMEGK